jgi:hypothetical protein
VQPNEYFLAVCVGYEPYDVTDDRSLYLCDVDPADYHMRAVVNNGRAPGNPMKFTPDEFWRRFRYVRDAPGRHAARLRDDLKLRRYAEQQGYTAAFEGDHYSNPLTFSRGDVRVWLCRQGWAAARHGKRGVTGGRYYDGLKEALDRGPARTRARAAE